MNRMPHRNAGVFSVVFNRHVWIHTAIGSLAVIPLSVLLLSDLQLRDVIIVLVFPLALTYGAALLTTRSVKNAVDILRAELSQTTAALILLMGKNRIVCHGTKYNVPNAHEFWNGLLISANHRFYLTGRSNKSWLNKARSQSDELGSAMIRIVQNGGSVRILSHAEPEFIQLTKRFAKEYIAAKLVTFDPHVRKALVEKLERNFTYCTCPQTNYSAVVSDDRMVIMPTPNSAEFRDEALVLEMTRQISPFEFHNYMSDIDRIFLQEGDIVELGWRAMIGEEMATSSATM